MSQEHPAQQTAITTIEQQLDQKTHWIHPDADQVARLYYQLDTIAESLDAPTIHPNVPNKFLAQSLTKPQRTVVDTHLGPLYSQTAVELQQRLPEIPIIESFQHMHSIPDRFSQEHLPASFSESRFNVACGEWAGKPRQFWVREGALDALVKLATAYQKANIMMHFEDAFRPSGNPWGVQEGFFLRRVAWVMRDNPRASFDEIMIRARAKTAVSPRISGHKAGAAVDVTLRTLEGAPLPLGNKHPESDAIVHLDCPFVTYPEWQTRMLFSLGFQMVGNSVYLDEDWHTSRWDCIAGINADGSMKQNYAARYGPIKNFDPQTGEIDPYNPAMYNQPFFSEQWLLANQAMLLEKFGNTT